jgi:hypothetical protein
MKWFSDPVIIFLKLFFGSGNVFPDMLFIFRSKLIVCGKIQKRFQMGVSKFPEVNSSVNAGLVLGKPLFDRLPFKHDTMMSLSSLFTPGRPVARLFISYGSTNTSG